MGDFDGSEHWRMMRAFHQADICGRCGEIWPCARDTSDIPGKPISAATRDDFSGPVHERAHPEEPVDRDVCNRCGETWPCFVTEIREEYAKLQKKTLSKENIALILWATFYMDFGEPMFAVTWEHCVETWEKAKKTTEDSHGGDCTGQAHSCIRCQYEETMTVAGKVAEALDV